MRARSALPALLCALLAACSSLLGADPGDLVGDWATEREAVSPTATSQDLLTLGADGRFVSEWRAYGVYPGQAADQLSASSRAEGRYRTEGGLLRVEAESITNFDTFGGRVTTTVQRPSPYGAGPYDGARFDVDGDRLTLTYLTYLTYPADAPRTTRRTFRREAR